MHCSIDRGKRIPDQRYNDRHPHKQIHLCKNDSGKPFHSRLLLITLFCVNQKSAHCDVLALAASPHINLSVY